MYINSIPILLEYVYSSRLFICLKVHYDCYFKNPAMLVFIIYVFGKVNGMSKSSSFITLFLINSVYNLCLANTFPNSAKSSSPYIIKTVT